jgi:dystonin
LWNQRIDSSNNQWKKIWENSNLYVERLKGIEIVLNGLEVMNKFVSRLEIQLVSKNMQYDSDVLREVQDGLIDMQSNIQIQQDAVDQLAEEASLVRQLVLRSRNSVNTTIRKHPDVDRLDAEIKAILTRLNNIRTHLVER